jgi:predicted nucleic acid-binding protein
VKAFFDTTVLVAAMVESHPHHERSVAWLRKAGAGDIPWVVAAHSLAETYAVLTTLPVKPRISPALASRLIRENVLASAEIVALSPREYQAAVARLADNGIPGGVIYDALLAFAAEKAEATRLLTLNCDDFRRAWPPIARIVQLP